MPELDPMKRRLTWTVYATPLMTLTTDLGLSIRVSMFEPEYVRLVIGTSSRAVPRRLDSSPLHTGDSGRLHPNDLTTADLNGSNNFRPKCD